MQITITNGTLTNIQETLSPSQGYALPSSVTVTGATSSYSDSTGLLQLTSPTSTMSVSAVGVAVVTPSISIGSLPLSDVYVGSTKISKIFLGSTLLWEAQIAPAPDNAILTSEGNYLVDSSGGYLTTTEITLISFTIDGTSYQAEQGMTWAEWCASNYNTLGATIDDTLVRPRADYAIDMASPSGTIIANNQYQSVSAPSYYHIDI